VGYLPHEGTKVGYGYSPHQAPGGEFYGSTAQTLCTLDVSLDPIRVDRVGKARFAAPPGLDVPIPTSLISDQPGRLQRNELEEQLVKFLQAATNDIFPGLPGPNPADCQSCESQDLPGTCVGADDVGVSSSGETSEETCGKRDNSDQNVAIDDLDSITTLMVKNIPSRCTQDELVALLEDLGFIDRVEFLYLPTKSQQNLGYAFVGLLSPDFAAEFCKKMTGTQFKNRKSRKTITVLPARIQGARDTMEHFSNSKTAPQFFRPQPSGCASDADQPQSVCDTELPGSSACDAEQFQNNASAE